MDPNNMTLQQFVEYADVYEYTQDHFNMERMFMELSLIQMHLEAYDFLQETADITLAQIECLMVESGTSDRSYYTEQSFKEVGGKIVEGTKKILITIGKAIAAFFRKLASIFSGGNKKAEESKEKIQAIDPNKIIAKAGQTAVDQQVLNDIEQGKDLIHEVVGRATGMKNDFQKLFDRADAMMGGGGVKVETESIDKDDNILQLIAQKFHNIPEIREALGAADDQAAMYIMTITKPQYQINTISFIAKMDEVVAKINELLHIEGDLGSNDHYNSFWKIMNQYGPDGMFERIGTLKNEVLAMSKRNESMTISAEVLQKKLESAEKLAAMFEKLASTADIGPTDLTSPIGGVFDKVQQQNPQITKREQVMNDFKGRYDRDKNLYGDRGAIAKPLVQKGAKALNWNNNRLEFMKYLRAVYELATAMQKICRDVIKLLTDHINSRNNAIAVVNRNIDAITEILNRGNQTIPNTQDDESAKTGSSDNDAA